MIMINTKVEAVLTEKEHQVSRGQVSLDAHLLHFVPLEGASATVPAFSLFYTIIQTMDRKVPTAQGYHPIYIICRNFLSVRLFLRRESDANDLYSHLQRRVNLVSLDHCYAFYYTPTPPLTVPTRGWTLYDPAVEFARLGVGSFAPNWRVSTINRDFELCGTYPRHLIFPAKISDTVIKHTAKFRSKCRIPVLSYIHRSNLTSLTRSSQPLVGLKQRQSIQDEKLVEAIFSSNLPEIHPPLPGYTNLIIDARPSANAMAQTAMGAGFESTENYRNCKVLFLGIDNIHVIRDSMNRLMEAVFQADSMAVPISQVDKSNWLKHIRNILDGAQLIVQHMHRYNCHVLVHCSDGWDRTAQLCSLVQLCMDPFYRTIEGFCILIEKEWLSYGHKFKDRCGHLKDEDAKASSPLALATKNMTQSFSNAFGGFFGKSSPFTTAASTGSSSTITSAAYMSVPPNFGGRQSLADNLSSSEFSTPNNIAPREISPIFSQFLDCVYQLWVQNPTHFQFNEHFLAFLNTHVYSCQFGTFLFNNEQERTRFRRDGKYIHECTVSIWDYVLSNQSEFVNIIYQGDFAETTEKTPTVNQGNPTLAAASSSPILSNAPSSSALITAAGTAKGATILIPETQRLQYWAALFLGRTDKPSLLALHSQKNMNK